MFATKAESLEARKKRNVSYNGLENNHLRSEMDRRTLVAVNAYLNNKCCIKKAAEYLQSLNRPDIGSSRKSVNAALLSDYGQELLEEWRSRMKEESFMSVEYKLRKLKKIIDCYIPDDAEIIPFELAKHAISAIAEANKMQGDYAPVKSETAVTTDKEQIEAKELLEKLKQEYKKEF